MAKPTQDAKKQITDKVRDVDTVLVAVNANPSVDELSAALGLTLALNKLGKHATAVFSGEVPMAIEFLEPGKTFENTVDSLRDFIIALDKEKADHLRYKVEGEMVKIFITPYQTTINETDLEFSQGDYNVELVLAIGVSNHEDLDRALSDHGRILHDATVAGISVGTDSSDIGSINLSDKEAGSYSEVVADLVTKLRGDKDLLDEQIATAFLTGIVAATDRFSNERTSSRAMTLSAQLMAAGANQQLIATKLEEAEELAQPSGIDISNVTGSDDASTDDTTDDSDDTTSGVDDAADNTDGTTKLSDEVRSKVDRKQDQLDEETSAPDTVVDKQAADGSMKISHGRKEGIDEVAERVAKERQEEAAARAEEILAQGLADTVPTAAPAVSVEDLQNDIKQATEEVAVADAPSDAAQPLVAATPDPQVQQPQDDASTQPVPGSVVDDFIETPLPPLQPGTPYRPSLATSEPAFGGTLNATSEQAAADKRREAEDERNKQLLSHHGGDDTTTASTNSPTANSFNSSVNDTASTQSDEVPAPDAQLVSSRGRDIQPLSGTGLTEPSPSAGDAMAAALSAASPTAQQQQHVPDVATLPPLPSLPQTSDPAVGGVPPLPPLPDFSTLPPLPPSAEPQLPTVSPENQGPIPPVVQASPSDPAAFQIPTQS